MNGLNRCEFIGNLTKDVTMRSTNTGKVVCSFSIACNRDYTDKNGQKQEIADFINVTAWEFLAKKAGNGLKKGARVYVSGRLTTRSYEQDGIKKYISEIVADAIEPIQFVQVDGGNQGFQAPKQQGFQTPSQGFNGGGNFNQFGNTEQVPF